jgi:hypothetical protein
LSVNSKDDERHSADSQRSGYEGITLLTIRNFMRAVVEFHSGDDSSRYWVDQHEIDVLLSDFASVPAFPFFRRDYIGESNFKGDQVAVRYGWFQALLVEPAFACTQ